MNFARWYCCILLQSGPRVGRWFPCCNPGMLHPMPMQQLLTYMRLISQGLCVFTSTLGTVIMPLLERFTGTMATGAWGIWYVP